MRQSTEARYVHVCLFVCLNTYAYVFVYAYIHTHMPIDAYILHEMGFGYDESIRGSQRYDDQQDSAHTHTYTDTHTHTHMHTSCRRRGMRTTIASGSAEMR